VGNSLNSNVLTIQTPRAFAPLLKPSRYKGAHGGRGSGKSHFFAELMIEACMMEKTDAVCVREIQKTLNQSVKKLLEVKINQLGVQSMFEIQESVIKCPYGGVITFQGMQNHTADSIKSLEGYKIAWVEEAQSLSQRSLDLLRPTIRAENSELWFSWNPNLQSDPVDVLLRGEHPPHDAIVVEANYSDNPWLPSVLYDEMEYDRRRDQDKYAHVWMGKYQQHSESRVFKNWVIEEFERPKGTVFRLGADWGYSVDPSVLIRCDIEGNRLYIDYEVYRIGCEIVNLPELFMGVPESEKWPITADSARPETISYMQKHGFPKMAATIKGTGSVEEGIQFLQSFDIVVHPRCTHAIDELTLYKYKTDPLTNKVIPVLEDKNNHVIDAIRYACEGARRVGKAKPAAPIASRMPRGGSWMGGMGSYGGVG
jgi:phage terminase large subunit